MEYLFEARCDKCGVDVLLENFHFSHEVCGELFSTIKSRCPAPTIHDIERDKILTVSPKEEKALKYDDGKPPMDLLPYPALAEVALVLGYGEKKYGRWNYMKGMEWSRLIAAALRHINQFNWGEDYDRESFKSHIAHAVCCLLMLLEYQLDNIGKDDRRK